MKLLTVITGILLALGGAFCYYFSTSPFSALAFIVGSCMVLAGAATILTYILSLRIKDKTMKLSDTVFVEGLVTFLFGFAVLNNQISEAMLTTFFGTWLTLAGASRLSQSFSISRHNTKDWAKILPMALVNTIAGVVLLMETLVEAYNPVALVGTAFIFNAISHFLHALYMKTVVPEKRAQLVKARKDAKEAVDLEKRRRRREKQKTSRAERRRQEKLRSEEIAKEALQAAAEGTAPEDVRNAVPGDLRPAEKKASTATMVFTAQQAAEVARLTAADGTSAEAAPGSAGAAAPAKRTAEEAKESLAKAAERNLQIPEIIQGPFADPWAGGDFSFEPDEEIGEADEAGEASVKAWDAPAFSSDIRPVWHKPVDIPSLRSEAQPVKPVEKETPVSRIPELKLHAVNLEELEDSVDVVSFDPVELPSVKLEAAGGEAAKRKEFLEALENTSVGRRENTSFQAIRLEDLFGDVPEKSVTEEAKQNLEQRLTSEYTFNWAKTDPDDL